MLNPAARLRRAADIDGRGAFLDIRDLARLIDYEAGAVGESAVGHEDTVGGGRLPIEKIAEERERKT